MCYFPQPVTFIPPLKTWYSLRNSNRRAVISNQDELDRIKAIRKRQIAARDPSKKRTPYPKRIATKYKRVRSKENFFIDGWKDLAKAWKGFLLGGFIGLIILLILPSFLPGPTGTLLGFASIIVCMVVGVALGGSFDWRDNIRDNLKR